MLHVNMIILQVDKKVACEHHYVACCHELSCMERVEVCKRTIGKRVLSIL